MTYLLIAIFTLVVPIFGRPQQPQVQNIQPQSGSQTTPVSIVSQTEIIGPDGSYNFSYDASNGIHVEQGGFVKPSVSSRSSDPNNPDGEDSGSVQVIQGAFSYTAPDGQEISLRYIADDNGFQPEGAHLPTAPPVPEAIARSLSEQQPDQQSNQQQQQGQNLQQ